MNNERNEQKPNLISRLFARLHSAKIYQASLGLIMATTLALTGCDEFQTTPSAGDTTESTSDVEQVETEEPKIGSSKLFQNVMSNLEYKILVDRADDNNELYKSAYFDPHPYAFLEDEGFDVDAIKDGELFCRTQSFVLKDEPNNLYIATYVDCGDYYEHFMLKYKLTNEEMYDYDYVHGHDYGKFYVESVFFNNEISKMKEPEIVANTKMTKEAHQDMKKSFINKLKPYEFGSDYFEIILKDYDTEKDSFNLYVMPYIANVVAAKQNGKVACFNIFSNSRIDVEGDIYIGPTSMTSCFMKEGTMLSAFKKATVYHVQNTDLTANKAYSFTN